MHLVTINLIICLIAYNAKKSTKNCILIGAREKYLDWHILGAERETGMKSSSNCIDTLVCETRNLKVCTQFNSLRH